MFDFKCLKLIDMFFKDVLSIFREKFKEIRLKSSGSCEEADQMIVVCNKTLDSLKQLVFKQGFESRDSEIRFFKEIKVVPMQYLIYYIEVRSFEIQFPKIGLKQQRKFLRNEMDKLNMFFVKHTEFLVYLDQGHEHFDNHYFTRKHLYDSLPVKSYTYYKDSEFNTAKDELLARVKAFYLFKDYVRTKNQEIERVTTPLNFNKTKNDIQWTGSYAAFVEMMYGCLSMGYFNHGNMNIGRIIEEIGDFLNVERGNSSRTYNELKNRKQSRIKFFEEAGQKLLQKMDREDG